MSHETDHAIDDDAVEKWRSSGDMARAALSCMSDAAFLVEAGQGVTAFNDAFVDYHRYQTRGHCERSVESYFGDIELRDQNDALLPIEQWPAKRALRGERASNVEYRLRRRDTGVTWVGSYSFAPIHDAARQVIGGILTAHDVTAQHEARRALDIEQQRLRMVLENTGTALWELDLEHGTIISGSPAWLKRYGYREDQAPRTFAAWLEIVHPDDRDSVTDALAALRSGASVSLEIEYRIRAGEQWRWTQSRATVTQRTSAGRPQRVTGVHLDTHERHVTGDTIRENEHLLQTVVDATELGVWDWELEGDSYTFNLRMGEMLGYTADELPDREACVALVHPQDWSACEHAMREHVAGRQPFFHAEMRLRARDGQWHWLLTSGQVVRRDAQGRALRMMGIHLDVTARKRTEAALTASETRLRTVVDNVPVGIVLIDAEGRAVFANDSYRRILHIPREQAPTFDWMAYLPPEERDELVRQQIAMLEGRIDEFRQEFHYQHPGHEPQIVRTRTIRIDAPEADFTFIGIGEDVTLERAQEDERRRLQRQVQQAQKMEAIGQLAGGIAHDFNNLLTAVVGFSELAMQRYVPDKSSKLAEYLSTVAAAGERGRELVAKMLAFSRRQPSVELQAVDVLKLAREVATMLGSILPSSIHFSVVDAGPAPLAQIDAIDLHQVLVNLVVNARDAINGHGAITLTVGAESAVHGLCTSCHVPLDGQRYVTVAVQDTGAGMEADTLLRVFEPFFTTKDIGRGTGMGLSVVHGVLHQAGGHIMVRSGPGSGTEFRLLLRSSDGDTPQLEVTPPAPRTGYAGLRVLVVDDDASVRIFMREMLEGIGVMVTVVEDGQAALERLRAAPGSIDLVFTDQTMPRMTGTELLTALRQAGLDTPVILCSGYSDAASRTTVVEQGAVFLAKPAAPDDILVALGQALYR